VSEPLPGVPGTRRLRGKSFTAQGSSPSGRLIPRVRPRPFSIILDLQVGAEGSALAGGGRWYVAYGSDLPRLFWGWQHKGSSP
jgi:hypothetical protein